MRRDGPEELADEPVGRPAGKRDRAARLADSEELRRRLLVVRSEHRPEHGRDGVERPVKERERLCVAFEKGDRQAFGGRALASSMEQRRDVVDADRGTTVTRSGDRGIAAARGDVEDAPARMQVGRVAELFGHEHDTGGDNGEVAAFPCQALALLDRAEVGERCFECRGHVVPFARCARWVVRGRQARAGAPTRVSPRRRAMGSTSVGRFSAPTGLETEPHRRAAIAIPRAERKADSRRVGA